MDDFFWQIKVPTDCARAGTLYTGTWNTRAWYKVSYKTNVSDFRQIGADLLSTNQNQLDLSATALGLQSGEYVTDIRLTFGTVPADFKVTVKPAFYLYVMPTVTNGYKCITRTEIGGKINDEWQTATATWTTNVIRKNCSGQSFLQHLWLKKIGLLDGGYRSCSLLSMVLCTAARLCH